MSEASPKNNREAEQKLSETAADNLQYFWQEQGNPDLGRMSAYDKRIIFDVPLLLYMDTPQPSSVSPKERNAAAEDFANKDWLPKSSAEINMVTARDESETFQTVGPAERLRRATHSGVGERSKAQKATFETVEHYRRDAEADKAVLRRALVVTSRGNQADVGLVRSDPEILNVIADYLHGREMLDRGLEYSSISTIKFKDRQKFWRGFMAAAVQPGFASDEVLGSIFMNLRGRVEKRLGYWTEQQQAAYKKVGHVLVDDVQETIIPVRQIEDQPVEVPPKSEVTAADSKSPWEGYQPPVRPGENYQLEGTGELRIREEDDDKSAPAKVKETSTPLPQPLFNMPPKVEAKKKTKKIRKRRPIKPSERRKPGYDHERDPSNPQPF